MVRTSPTASPFSLVTTFNARIVGGGVARYDQMVMFSPEAPLVQTQLIEKTYYDEIIFTKYEISCVNFFGLILRTCLKFDFGIIDQMLQKIEDTYMN